MRTLGKDEWVRVNIEKLQTDHDDLNFIISQSKRPDDCSSPGYLPKPEHIRTI